MDSKTLLIPFRLEPPFQETEAILDVNPGSIMRTLMSLGYAFFDLDGIPGAYSKLIESESSNVLLWVDDDAKEFAASYCELELIAKAGQSTWKHYVFLRDGLLQITAACQDGRAHVKIEKCPGINRLYLSNHAIIISEVDYLYTWRNAMHFMITATEVR